MLLIERFFEPLAQELEAQAGRAFPDQPARAAEHEARAWVELCEHPARLVATLERVVDGLIAEANR